MNSPTQLGVHKTYDPSKARDLFENLANRGNSSAQGLVGMFYSFGVGGERHLGKGMLYYTLGSLNKDSLARMAVGFRGMYGVLGSVKNCFNALDKYRKAAAQGGFPLHFLMFQFLLVSGDWSERRYSC
jgi:TPR repeat protein